MVFDDIVSPSTKILLRELTDHAPFHLCWRDAIPRGYSGDPDRPWGSYQNHAVHLLFAIVLKQQRRLVKSQSRSGCRQMTKNFLRTLRDQWVHYYLKPSALGLVSEHNGRQAMSVKFARRPEYTGSEGLRYLRVTRRPPSDNLASYPVGADHRKAQPFEHCRYSRLPRPNPPGEAVQLH